MTEKAQSDGEYKFFILGQHTHTKVSSGNKKKLTVTEVTTATILARFVHDGKVFETVIPKVPLFLWDAYHKLESSGEVNNEIFRKSGSQKRITDFFNQNPTMYARGTNFAGLQQLDIGMMMKDFLRERYEPCFISGDVVLNDLEHLIKLGVGIEFDTDQNPEYSNFLFAIKVLHSLCLKDESGRLTPSNLAIYFTPIFIQEPKDAKTQTMNKTGPKLARHINLLTNLIAKSQNLVVKSTGRYRSNSITPGMSLRDEEGRRSSSVIGRIMRYVNKERIPKVTAVPAHNLINREFTPDGRQARSRTRRTPSSSAKRTVVLTPIVHTPKGVHHQEEDCNSSFRNSAGSHNVRNSLEKEPKMRDEDRVEYLMEARKRLDFKDDEDNQPLAKETIPLDELLISLQKSVDNLSTASLGTPVPTDPSLPSTPSKSATPPHECPSPEQILEEVAKHCAEEEAEMNSVCEEFALTDAKLEALKKETKDQGCSPIRFSLSTSAIHETSPLSFEFKQPSTDKLSQLKAPLVHKLVKSPSKVHPKPTTWRTISGGFDGNAAARIVASSTQEELQSQYDTAGMNFPLHRPSIALLTKSKQVTRNIARLEEVGTGVNKIEPPRNSFRARQDFTKATISSEFKSKPSDDFKVPSLPKSRSMGSATASKFKKPALPPKDLPRDPAVPSYASATFASVQHSQTRILHDLNEAQNESSPAVDTEKPALKDDLNATIVPETFEDGLSPLDGLAALVSKMSFNSPGKEQENS